MMFGIFGRVELPWTAGIAMDGWEKIGIRIIR